jgi:predicted oxidoreductase
MTFKTTLLALTFVATAFSSSAIAQTHDHTKHQTTKSTKSTKTEPPMPKMMDMEKCKADMKAGQAKLDDLTAKMNASQGEEKTNSTAAVINEMMIQKKAMDEMCVMMMDNMKAMSMPKKTVHKSKHHKKSTHKMPMKQRMPGMKMDPPKKGKG